MKQEVSSSARNKEVDTSGMSNYWTPLSNFKLKSLDEDPKIQTKMNRIYSLLYWNLIMLPTLIINAHVIYLFWIEIEIEMEEGDRERWRKIDSCSIASSHMRPLP